MLVSRLFATMAGLALVMVAFAFWAAAGLPAGTELPTHWNAAGEVDDTMPALHALLIGPAMLIVVSIVLAIVPRIEPLQDRLEASAPLLRAGWVALALLSVFLQLFIAAPLFGIAADVRYVLVAVGLLLVWIGNMLPKSRPGFFVGIRTPWTIADTDTWIATHRLGGKTFMIGGAILILGGLIDMAETTRTYTAIAAIGIAALTPVIYSWWHWRSTRSQQGGEKR